MKIFILEYKYWWVGIGVYEIIFVVVWILFFLGEEDGCEVVFCLGVLGWVGGGFMLLEFLCIVVVSFWFEDLFILVVLYLFVGEILLFSLWWWYNWLVVLFFLNWEDEYFKNGLFWDW